MFAIIITLFLSAIISGLYGIYRDTHVDGAYAMSIFGLCVGTFGLLGVLDMGLWHPANYGWFWWTTAIFFTIGGYGLATSALYVARWMAKIDG